MANKGPQYERDFCKNLSLWWTGNKREDIFWRTAGSGARATTRQRQNKTTAGQYGDVGFIDPIGKPLIDIMAIELKRGYVNCNFQKVFSKLEGAAQQEWESWYQKAKNSAVGSNAFSWIIIHSKNRRREMVYFPDRLLHLFRHSNLWSPVIPSITFKAELTEKHKIEGTKRFEHTTTMETIHGMRWEDLLTRITPKLIKTAAEMYNTDGLNAHQFY